MKRTAFTSNSPRMTHSSMNRPTELDIAQLKYEMRVMYGHLGFEGSLQVMYEMIVGANTLAEVILEERTKGAGL
jgi:hypothetical protein